MGEKTESNAPKKNEPQKEEKKQPAQADTKVKQGAETAIPQQSNSNSGISFLIVLVLISLGISSLYFYDRQNRMKEEFNALSGEFANYRNNTEKLMKEYENILKQVNAVNDFNNSISERIDTLSENQRIDSSRVDDVIRHITVKERSEVITELKKALLIVGGISAGKGNTSSKRASKKLQNDIKNLIDQFSRSSEGFETGQQEQKSAGQLLITPQTHPQQREIKPQKTSHPVTEQKKVVKEKQGEAKSATETKDETKVKTEAKAPIEQTSVPKKKGEAEQPETNK